MSLCCPTHRLKCIRKNELEILANNSIDPDFTNTEETLAEAETDDSEFYPNETVISKKEWLKHKQLAIQKIYNYTVVL